MKLSARPPAPPTPPPSSSPSSASSTLRSPFQACLIPSSTTVNYFPFSSSSAIPFFWSVVTQCRALPAQISSHQSSASHWHSLFYTLSPSYHNLSLCQPLPSFYTIMYTPVSLQYSDRSWNLSVIFTCTSLPKTRWAIVDGRNRK